MTVRATEAPLSRAWIDIALPFLRFLFGVGFIAYSTNATILIAAADLMWLFAGTKQTTIGYFADAYWYSSMLALVLFVGEVATAERNEGVYKAFVTPDAFYTARQMQPGLQLALTILFGGSPAATVAAMITSWVASAIIGYHVAKWGEILLFGKRRKLRGTRKTED